MENFICKPKLDCVACGGTNLDQLLDLNDQPLANSYHGNEPGLQQDKYPLRLNVCRDCYHLQLSHIVHPTLMFDNYLYVSGTSQTLRDYFRWFAEYAVDALRNWSGESGRIKVLDIACNDGSQLDAFADKYGLIETTGVDPAKNLHSVASQRHRVFCNYFSKDIFDTSHEWNRFNIIIAQNVFAHTENALDFLKDAASILEKDGLIFIQTSQAEMVRSNQFDTVYHEHISYFNIHSMDVLCKRAGVHLVDVVKVPVHGISYVFVISPSHDRRLFTDNHLEIERLQGLQSIDTYRQYADNVHTLVNTLRSVVRRAKVEGTVVGYGAAAKGMTLLNYLEVYPDIIIDDNPMKQGMYTPGSNIPIVSSEWLRSDEANINKIYFMPLAWNFYDEIRKRIKSVRDNSDDLFIRYFPTVKMGK